MPKMAQCCCNAVPDCCLSMRMAETFRKANRLAFPSLQLYHMLQFDLTLYNTLKVSEIFSASGSIFVIRILYGKKGGYVPTEKRIPVAQEIGSWVPCSENSYMPLTYPSGDTLIVM